MWYTFCIKTFCIQNLYKVLSKCGIQLYAKTLHFAYISYIYINSDPQEVYIINIMYIIFIQNCMHT